MIQNNIIHGPFRADVNAGAFESGFALNAGTYTCKAVAPGFLQKAISLSISPSTPVSGVTLTLKLGDLDGDNFVSQAEVDFIQSSVGADLEGFDILDDPAHAYDIRLCDHDRDGEVSSGDYLAALVNIGVYGD